MRHRILALAVITAAVPLAATVAPSSAATNFAAGVKCSQGSTLGASKSSRVFVAVVKKQRRVFACTAGVKQVRYLGLQGGDNLLTSVMAVTGPRVAYLDNDCGDSVCVQNVFVYDIRKGTQVSGAFGTLIGTNDQVVTDLVLGTTGTVAWIAENGGTPVARTVSIRKPGVFTQTPNVPVASGLDILKGSLATSGSLVYWTQGAAAKVLPLG